MTAYDIIMKKRRGYELDRSEIEWFIEGYVNGNIPDYQASALLMAICFNSMTAKETSVLTMAMMNSGELLCPSKELGEVCIDKHSTGGVGDKTTLIVAPICAACGMYIPKMSGRGLGHTGGTIDKLEAIPGFQTGIVHEKFIATVKKAGFSVASQTGKLVPADKMLYALRDATATVDSIPLICSSIMSKKLATGADGIVLDVKVGNGAFMKNIEDAVELAEEMIKVGKLCDRKCTAVLSDMEQPLGMTVGNSVEVIEAIEALKGNCADDLREISLTLAAEMLVLGGKGTAEECRVMAEKAMLDGTALERLKVMIEMQGGNSQCIDDYTLLGTPEYSVDIVSDWDGYIMGISCENTGLLALSLGAGRKNKEDTIDKTAGIIFNHKTGDYVRKGDVLGTIMSSVVSDLENMKKDFADLFTFCDNKCDTRKTVINVLRNTDN